MAETGPATYDGFLSYSHAADDLLAPRLQSGLQRFAKPWWKRRALRVFRDEASLSANPHLWESITSALGESEWFVLLLSPEAAESEWVNREIDYWTEHKDPGRILPVVTDGTFGWAGGDVAGDAVPESLRGVFQEEPRWVDLRFARSETQLNLRHARFRDAVADIAAAVRGVAKDELESEEIRQHRRTIRIAWTASIAILALGIAATVGAVVAYTAQQDAQDERDRANLLAEQEAAARTEAEQQRELAKQEAQRAEEESARAEEERIRAEEQTAVALASADLARSRELAASAINVLDDDPELSVLLALEAAEGADPAFESVVALRSALQQHRAVRTMSWPEDWKEGIYLVGSMSPDGRYVAASGARHQMAVWDLESPSDEPLWRFEVPYPDHAVIVPYFSSDGTHVIATVAWFSDRFSGATQERTEPPPEVGVYVWDVRTGGVIHHLRGPDCPINGLFQNGRFLDETRPVAAVATAEDDCSVGYGTEADLWLIDFTSGDMLLGSTHRVPGWMWLPVASLTEDERYVSWSDGYSASGLMDLATGENAFEATEGWFSLTSKDGTRFLAAEQRRFEFWDITAGIQLWEAEVPSRLTDLWFSDDETLLYGGTVDGAIRIWDATTGQLAHELKGHRDFSWGATLSREKDRLTSFSGDRTMRIWDLTAAAEGEIHAFELPGTPPMQSGNFVSEQAALLVYEPESVFLEPGLAVIVNTSSGRVKSTFDGYGAQMVRLSPDGTLLAGQPFIADGVLGPVHVRDVETGEVLFELEDWCSFGQNDNEPGVDCAAFSDALGDALWWLEFSPDGTMIAASGDRYGQAGVWDAATGKRLTWLSELPSGSGDIVVLRFSPDSAYLAAANPGLTVFETEGWSVVAETTIDAEWYDLHFTPDGHYLLGGGLPAEITLIDTGNWEHVGEPLPSAGGAIRNLAVSPDGSTIASANSDRYVQVWDTETQQLLHSIPVGDGTPTLIHFLDNQHLLIIAQGRPALVVTTHIPELIDIARSRITRGFTDSECTTYHIGPCPDLETIRSG